MSDWNRSDRDRWAARGRYGRGFPGENPRGRPYPRPEDEDGREGFDRYGVRGERDYRGEVPRGPAGVPYRGYGAGYEEPGYGPEGGVVGINPALDRVAWGEVDPAPHEARHRGRGPRNYTRPDTRICEDVCDRLSEDAWLDPSEIEVQVENGEVRLTGMVESREAKLHAEDLAWQAGAVKHVQNDLRVAPPADGAARA